MLLEGIEIESAWLFVELHIFTFWKFFNLFGSGFFWEFMAGRKGRWPHDRSVETQESLNKNFMSLSFYPFRYKKPFFFSSIRILPRVGTSKDSNGFQCPLCSIVIRLENNKNLSMIFIQPVDF